MTTASPPTPNGDEPDDERSTGPLASCGRCTNGTEGVVIDYACDVHGGLAEWLTSNVDPRVVAKTTEAARNAEHASRALNTVLGAVADLCDKVSVTLRPKG